MRNVFRAIFALLLACVGVFGQLFVSFLVMCPCLLALAFRIPSARQTLNLFLYFVPGWLLLILIGYITLHSNASDRLLFRSIRCASVTIGMFLTIGGFRFFGGGSGLFAGQMDVSGISVAVIPGVLLISQGIVYRNASWLFAQHAADA